MQIPTSGEKRFFDTGARRDSGTGKGRYDLIPPCATKRLALRYEGGAVHYGDRNWEKGMPMHVLMDSALRHMNEYIDGDTREDHLAAAAWNIFGAMFMEENRPEMQDLPKKVEGCGLVYKQQIPHVVTDGTTTTISVGGDLSTPTGDDKARRIF